MEFDVDFFDFVNFTDEADTQTQIGTLAETLSLNDSMDGHYSVVSTTDLLTLDDSITFNAVYHFALADTLSFTDEIYHLRGTATDLLQLFDSFTGVVPLNDFLDLEDMITGVDSTLYGDTVDLEDVISYNYITQQSLSDTFGFNDSFSGFVFNYTVPAVPIVTPLPTVVLTSTINLGSVTLPAPEFGDSRTQNYKRINKVTRGDDIIISGEPNWFPTFLRKYEWTYLSEDKCIALRAFMKNHVGIPVSVLNHYGETMVVVFLRPDAEFSQVGRENRTVTLDMQVVE